MDRSIISMRGIGKVKKDGPILIKISEKTERRLEIGLFLLKLKTKLSGKMAER